MTERDIVAFVAGMVVMGIWSVAFEAIKELIKD